MPDIYTKNTEKDNLSPSFVQEKVDFISAKKLKNTTSVIGSMMKKGYSHNPLSAFSIHPDGVRFTVKDPDEKIILLLRKHPITNLPWLIFASLAIVIPPFFTLFDLYNFLPLDYRFIVNLLWYLFVTAFVLEKFLQWFFNVNVITDERIIDVNFHNLIYREISDANIDQIQDVTVEVGGGIRTFLNYGNVTIQTAAEVLRIDLEDIPMPDDVAKVLRELRVEEEIEKLEGRAR